MKTYVKVFTLGAMICSSVCFGQQAAALPAFGYVDSFQGNYLNNIVPAATTPIVNIMNLGSSAVANGDICANVYAFAPTTGNLLTCCSCRIPPNALRTMNGPNLGAAVVSSNNVVLKILASIPKPSGNACDATTSSYPANGVAGGFASGLQAWATHLPFLFPSDSQFSPGALSQAELTRIATACAVLPVANQCTCAGNPAP